jgi:outer membrane protein
MKRLVFLLFAALSAFAGDVEIIVDAEGVHRQSDIDADRTGTFYEPEFDNGGGLGVGVNWFMTGRVSLELKAAVLASDMQIRIVDGDFVGKVNVGYVNMVPVTAVVQWHPFEDGVALRPYVGAGVAHVFLEDVAEEGLVPRTEFSNTTGLVLNAGLRVSVSKRWSLAGDVRYVPVETSGRVRFANQETESDLDVRPLIVGFGIVYHF